MVSTGTIVGAVQGESPAPPLPFQRFRGIGPCLGDRRGACNQPDRGSPSRNPAGAGSKGSCHETFCTIGYWFCHGLPHNRMCGRHAASGTSPPRKTDGLHAGLCAGLRGKAWKAQDVQQCLHGTGRALHDCQRTGLQQPAVTKREVPTKKGGPDGTALVSFAWLKKRQAALGSAAFACAMIAVNTPPSFIARSAMTFRSSSIPASFTPCMNCE
jgi:hypothetical protein